MITLTSDKLAPIKRWFPMEDLVRHGPRRPTPKQITSPGDLAPLRKIVQDRTGLYSAMGWDDAYQEALYPHLLKIA
jgi:hypothetical protein